VADVFISFIHQEDGPATLVSTFLNDVFQDQIKIFQSSDRRAIYAGEEWMKKIFDALQVSKVLISMMSPESVKRPWINFETGAAWMRGTPVIPVCFDGLTIADLPKPYSSLQAIEVEAPDQCYYLADSIAHHVGLSRPEKPADFYANVEDRLLSAGTPADKLSKHAEALKQTKLNRPYRNLSDGIKEWQQIRDLLSRRLIPDFFEDRPSE
jgi:hypothetical protein